MTSMCVCVSVCVCVPEYMCMNVHVVCMQVCTCVQGRGGCMLLILSRGSQANNKVTIFMLTHSA